MIIVIVIVVVIVIVIVIGNIRNSNSNNNSNRNSNSNSNISSNSDTCSFQNSYFLRCAFPAPPWVKKLSFVHRNPAPQFLNKGFLNKGTGCISIDIYFVITT